MIEYAVEKNSLIGGDDFKSGQTKMKSVLVDFLVGAGIKVSSLSMCTEAITLRSARIKKTTPSKRGLFQTSLSIL